MNNIRLRIKTIQDLEFSINAPVSVDPKELGVQVEGKDMVAHGDSKTVTLTTEVRYVHDYESTEAKLILKYVNDMTFYVDNFDDVFELEGGKYVFEAGLVHFLLDIITPTIRGILFAKTAGTGLANCYLPLIRADQLIQE